MYNDFVIVGPKAIRPASKGKDIVAALQKIAAAKATFISRGDKSGTHAAELRYWKAAGIDRAARQGRAATRMRLRHGAGAEHRGVGRTPTC